MKTFIQQPSYLPWIGYFEQIYQVDIFVFFDDVQFNKKTWKTRNRIKTHNGELWLTVPVLNANSHDKIIKDVKIDYGQNWVNKHLRSIYFAYKSSGFFEEIYSIIEIELKKKKKYLAGLNCELIRAFSRYLKIDTKFVNSSDLEIFNEKGDLKIIEICKKCNSNYLYNGSKAKEILDLELFQREGITVEFQDFNHPTYPQLHGSFIPYLSIIDLLFNCGPESGEYIWGNKLV